MKNGVLSHHLHMMEKAGIITAIRHPRQSRFYLPSISVEESNVIRALRRQTTRFIIESLILNEPLTFQDLTSDIDRASSTISLYLSKLVSDGVVRVGFSGRTKTYRLDDRRMIDRLVEDYRPGILDGPATGLEDIINNL